MENNLPEGFTVFAFPEPIRKRLRTSLERSMMALSQARRQGAGPMAPELSGKFDDLRPLNVSRE
jgi:hypothetical protein